MNFQRWLNKTKHKKRYVEGKKYILAGDLLWPDGIQNPWGEEVVGKKKDQSCMRSDHKSVVETLMKYGLVKPQHKINKARLETPTLFLMACCLPSRLKATDLDGSRSFLLQSPRRGF
ncbi:hypothetical protein TNCT_485701 [Trichonephila clavata]|uniref:Uncharacterized protein n=1 Tax=Trichonephila clavata TaxID=2740835 RepID=A0A8X6LSP2_TRICU|nr:hypothetical protein TNCT_485701 [Trichonephila clavata]